MLTFREGPPIVQIRATGLTGQPLQPKEEDQRHLQPDRDRVAGKQQVCAGFIQAYVAYFDAQLLTDAWPNPGAGQAICDSAGSTRPTERVVNLVDEPDVPGEDAAAAATAEGGGSAEAPPTLAVGSRSSRRRTPGLCWIHSAVRSLF